MTDDWKLPIERQAEAAVTTFPTREIARLRRIEEAARAVVVMLTVNEKGEEYITWGDPWVALHNLRDALTEGEG